MRDLSIIIPTNKRPQYLKEMLASLVPNKSNFEIIVVNDSADANSDYGYADVIYPFRFIFEERLQYFSYIDNKLPGNCLYPIRFGIGKSKGEYIKIVGDDDYLEPYSIDGELNYLIQHVDYYDGLVTGYAFTNEHLQLQTIYQPKNDITPKLLREGCFIPDFTMLKRYFWDDITWREDVGSRWLWVVWYEMLKKGMKLSVLPQVCNYRYRQHGNQIKHLEETREYNKMLPKIFDELDEKYKCSI